jgi:hypothetical protein
LGNLGQPTAVFLTFALDVEVHGGPHFG